MKALLKSLLESKKTAATVVAVLVWVIGKAGFDVDALVLLPVVGSIMALVLAIGWADMGKEAEKVKLEGPTPDFVKKDK